MGKTVEIIDPAPHGYSYRVEKTNNRNGHEAQIWRATQRTTPAPDWPPVECAQQSQKPAKAPSGLDEAVAAAIKAGVPNARALVDGAPNKGVAVMRLRNAMKARQK